MPKFQIRSMLLFFSISAALILILTYAAVIIHAQQTSSTKLLYSLPLLGSSLRAEDVRSEAQKSKELAWKEEAAQLPHKNYAEWLADVLNPETPLSSLEWKELLWKKGGEIKKRDTRVILRYSDKIAIGDLPNYTGDNEYEINNIKRQVDNSLVFGTNEERLELDLPVILIHGSTDDIRLSQRNKLLAWLIQNPQSTVVIILAFLMLLSLRKQLNIFLDSHSSKKTFVKYKPQKGNIKTLKDIGGLPHVHREINRFIAVAQYPNIMRAFGGRLLPGVLLSGVPGTGKSLTAEVLANIAYKLGFSVYKVESGRLMDIAAASAPNKIRDGFRRARRDRRAMIIFDEVEAFARTRGEAQSGSAEEKSDALVQLLTEIEGVANSSAGSIVVVLISNRPELIDAALLRSGRVGLHLRLYPPKEKEARYEILSIHAKGSERFPPGKKEEWLDIMAEQTEGFTGADLRKLLEDAGIITGTPHAEELAKLRMKDRATNLPKGAYLELEHLITARVALTEQLKQEKIENKTV